MAEKLFVILANHFRDNCGVCRYIETLYSGLDGYRKYVITGAYKGSVDGDYEILHHAAGANADNAKPLLVFKNQMHDLRTLKGEEVILHSLGFPSHFSAVAYKLLFNRRAKILSLIFDREEFSIDEVGVVPYMRYEAKILPTRLSLKLGLINKILVLDSRVKDFVKDKTGEKDIEIIRVGISRSLIERAKEGYADSNHDDAVRILTHGIIIPRRRIEDIIDAIAIIEGKVKRRIILTISGGSEDGKYLSLLKDKAGKISSEVIFRGEVDDSELANLYRQCDIFVWAANPQTWGLAPLEAMSFGKPTIVSEGSGVSEVLNKEIAMLVPPNSPLELSQCLAELINDMERGREMGKGASKFVAENLTFINTAETMRSLLSKM